MEVTASSIGAVAFAKCQQVHSAEVAGVTSHGLFLLVPPQQIIFVSFERYRSPLTINLERSFDQLRVLAVGAAAQLSDTRLIFPAIEFSISFSTAVVWRCPPPSSAPRLPAEQLRALRAITEGVLMRRSSAGLAALLPRLLALSHTTPLSVEYAVLLDRLLALQRAVQTGDSQSILVRLTGLLGQGRGLTPSGDDVVIGLLLMLARFPGAPGPLRGKHHTAPAQWVQVSRADHENMLKQVAPLIVAEAYKRTTTISANLIECAADGQGDERLITVVDGMAAGSASIDKCIDSALDWGSSSGIDALVGMAMSVAVL